MITFILIFLSGVAIMRLSPSAFFIFDRKKKRKEKVGISHFGKKNETEVSKYAE